MCATLRNQSPQLHPASAPTSTVETAPNIFFTPSAPGWPPGGHELHPHPPAEEAHHRVELPTCVRMFHTLLLTHQPAPVMHLNAVSKLSTSTRRGTQQKKSLKWYTSSHLHGTRDAHLHHQLLHEVIGLHVRHVHHALVRRELIQAEDRRWWRPHRHWWGAGWRA